MYDFTGSIGFTSKNATYIIGAQDPGYARGTGLKTRAAFEEALQDVKKKYLGDHPNILLCQRLL